MYIILRLVCENFSRIAVKISFLGGPKRGVYPTTSFSSIVMPGCLHNDTQFFSAIMLYMHIIYISHSDCLMVTLKFYTIPMFLHAVRYFLNQKAFSSIHVSTIFPRKDDVISKLRHSYAKGPFCVARLIYLFQYVTQNSTYTRQNTMSFIIPVLITMFTLVSGVHVCDKVI